MCSVLCGSMCSKHLSFEFGQDAEEVIRTMKTTGLGSPTTNSATIDAFRAACHERFPYAVVFFPPNTYTGPQVMKICLLPRPVCISLGPDLFLWSLRFFSALGHEIVFSKA